MEYDKLIEQLFVSQYNSKGWFFFLRKNWSNSIGLCDVKFPIRFVKFFNLELIFASLTTHIWIRINISYFKDKCYINVVRSVDMAPEKDLCPMSGVIYSYLIVSGQKQNAFCFWSFSYALEARERCFILSILFHQKV